MATEGRQRWFAALVESGLAESIFAPPDILAHATPEVLAKYLPADLMSKVLEAALSAGSMTADGMLQTLTPAVLAEHIPEPVLWQCVTAVAERAGLVKNADGSGGDEVANRKFLERVVDAGRACSVLSPEDLLRHVTPDVLAAGLPVALKAKLLSEALKANAMNPTLVVDTVGVAAIATHIPVPVLWGCVLEAGNHLVAESASDVGDKTEIVAPAASATAAAPAKKAGVGSKRKSSAPSPAKASKSVSSSARARSHAVDDGETHVGDEWSAQTPTTGFEVMEEIDDLAAATDAIIGATTGAGGAGGAGDWPTDEKTDATGARARARRGRRT